MKASTIRSTRTDGGARTTALFGALLLVLSGGPSVADDWARSALEDALAAQGGDAVARVTDLYVRVRFKAFEEGSAGKRTRAEGFLRQFYRPTDLLRIEEEKDDGSGEVALIKVYDVSTGKGSFARVGREGVRPITDEQRLEDLGDHVRTLRYLLISFFLRDGVEMTYLPRGRREVGIDRIEWTDGPRAEAEEMLTLKFRNRWLVQVDVEPRDESTPLRVVLEDHEKTGGILFPRQATVFRVLPDRTTEKIMEVSVLPSGLVVNPTGLAGAVYTDPSVPTPR